LRSVQLEALKVVAQNRQSALNKTPGAPPSVWVFTLSSLGRTEKKDAGA